MKQFHLISTENFPLEETDPDLYIYNVSTGIAIFETHEDICRTLTVKTWKLVPKVSW